METNKKFEATIYTRILSSYLILNGIYTIFVFFIYFTDDLLRIISALESLPFNDIITSVTFVITGLIIPLISIVLGSYLILKYHSFIKYVGIYLLAAIPIFGTETWLYSFAHGMALHFQINLMGFIVGLNFTPIIGLVLLAKHLPNNALNQTVAEDAPAG